MACHVKFKYILPPIFDNKNYYDYCHPIFFSDVRLNLQEGVKLAKDICNGIKYIHTLESLVHRYDLNPHNILVRE